MKTIQKGLLVLFTIFIIGCTGTERKGLTPENRFYTNDIINYKCEDQFKYIMNDLILELENLTLDNISELATKQLDSVLGSEFISSRKKAKFKQTLSNEFFLLKEEIEDSTLLIGTNNLWNIKNAKEFFNQNTIFPKVLDWKKMMTCGRFKPITVNFSTGKWNIEQKMVPCISSNWSEVGQFKKVEKRKEQIDVFASYQYQFELNITIHLSVTNTEDNKTEYYNTTIYDNPKGYTTANFSSFYRLDGLEVPNSANNEHKKVRSMKRLE